MKSFFIFLFFSQLLTANPIISIDESELVKDSDILLKAEANQKAQRIEEDLTKATTPMKIEVVVDSSGSMGQILAKNKTKMYYLKELMKEFFKARWKEKNTIGLRVYSGITKDKCTDIRMTVPFGQTNIDKMDKAVQSLSPLGMTPLHESLKYAFEDLKTFSGPKRVVVVTDGQDTCGGDPCKTVEEWKKQNLDLKFYVIALGFKGDSESFKKIQCIGDTHVANDDQSFNDAMSQIGSKLSNKTNLEVVSPNPGASVYLYKIEGKEKKLFKVFYAYSQQTVPPGEYEAVINLQPAYKFSQFTIPPNKKITLKAIGDGQFIVNYFNHLVNVEVLDKNNRVVSRFKSDKPELIPTGKWQIRIFKDPFYEYLLPNYYIYPMGKHEFNVSGVGAVKINSENIEGIYVYDESKKDIGNYLSNTTAILKDGVYTFHVNDKCSFPDIQIKDKKEIIVLTCPK
ncbi:MAG: VWA domain-containing protein [Bdellovibrionaceae bacterium]|nr:VWA domain-containing protein [Pseudobdellovibrionaceae bacterium]NUM57540.1 VWA domain-containing protein [Pseudobdellovibrionaceae bacterium]